MVTSFDCYGTLIDWEEGILRDLGGVLRSHGVDFEREDLLSLYALYEKEIEKDYRPYSEVLVLTAEKVLRRFGLNPTEEEKNVLVEGITSWPPFDDVKTSLEKIKKHSKIAIISNIDNWMIEKSIEKMGVRFDFVVTAEMVKAYKPSLRVFEAAMETFGVSKSQWIHVGQSVFHDIIPAKRMGIRTVRLLRRGYGATPKVEEKADYTFRDLSELAENFERIIHDMKTTP